MKKLADNELLGAVVFENNWRFFSGTIGEWIMDYKAYDPSYDAKKWPDVFRNNLLQVDESNASQFCEAMKAYELTIDDVKELISENGPDKVPLTILINFDTLVYVNGYYDLLLEDYIPKNWKGIMDDPLKYVPEFIKSIWR